MKRPRGMRRVLVHGLVYFGPLFAGFMSGDGWEFRYYPDKSIPNLAAMLHALCTFDLVYQLGGRVTQGRFLKIARALDKKKIVMHWMGSDTLDERPEVLKGKSDPWVLHELHHWAESEWMIGEVRELGVPCQLVPFPSALVPSTPSPLPKQFSVLVYVPSMQRAALYGLDRILEVARQLPYVSFDLVGLLDGPISDAPNNVRVHGRVPNLAAFYRECCVVWRPVRHDGVSWMVQEALGHGRHVLWTYPFPGCIRVEGAPDALDQIVRLYDLHRRGLLQINQEGVRFTVCGGYHPQTLRSKIHSLLQEILDS